MNSLKLFNEIFKDCIPKGYILIGIKNNVMELKKGGINGINKKTSKLTK